MLTGESTVALDVQLQGFSIRPGRGEESRGAGHELASAVDEILLAGKIARELVEFAGRGRTVALLQHTQHKLVLRLGGNLGAGISRCDNLAVQLYGAVQVALRFLGVNALLEEVRGGLGAGGESEQQRCH